MLYRLLYALLLLSLSACSLNLPSHETPYIDAVQSSPISQPGALKHRVLLLGDAGHSQLEPLQASLQKAAELAEADPSKTSVVMLGDNIYYYGFPNKEAGQSQFTEEQLEDISHLEAQLHIAKRSGAEIFVVPGNHDWYATQLDTQAQYVSEYAQEHHINAYFEPYEAGHAPLPEVVHREGISLVFVDSMWLIKADLNQYQNAMRHLNTLLQNTQQQHPNNIVLVTAHHPIETMGPHNRYYTSTLYKAFISIAELFFDNDQDTDHPRYQRMIGGMELVLGRYDKAIYAAGHDHNLQVFQSAKPKAPQYRLVSGAANTSKITGVGTNENTRFALAQEGLMQLDVYEHGTLLQVYDIHHQHAVFQQWLWPLSHKQ